GERSFAAHCDRHSGTHLIHDRFPSFSGRRKKVMAHSLRQHLRHYRFFPRLSLMQRVSVAAKAGEGPRCP
ncbi:MAG: hypothetical protein ACREP9_05870, partial [Candidatus Dormibacteraceae bacterium]